MATRYFLTLVVFQLAITVCRARNDIIWCKQRQEFIQLFSIRQFAALREERKLAVQTPLERNEFGKEIVKAAYYEEKNMVMFNDDNTKVTGICGELWYLLGDYLNFTFVPIKSIDRNFGDRLENGSYNGLVGMLMRNEVQVILRSGFFSARMNVVDYTKALWKSKFHIYAQPELLYDNSWVLTLFSPRTWYSVVFLFIVSSFVGYFLQRIPSDCETEHAREDTVDFSLSDHVFHSYAIMCAQGYIPDAFYNKFKILSLSKSIFAWLVLLAFSSHLIYRMANRETMVAFKDIETLFNNTKYTLLAFRGSFLYNSLYHKYVKNDGEKSRNILGERLRFFTLPEEMYRTICEHPEKYAMFEIEDRHMALKTQNCRLQATGNFNETWITFAIKKNFPYKKAIDVALIKFNEVGLMDAIQDRWLNFKLTNKKKNVFKTIDLQQVYLIFIILCYGVLISLAIFILENVIYYYEKVNSRSK